jgi:hypothetical protein
MSQSSDNKELLIPKMKKRPERITFTKYEIETKKDWIIYQVLTINWTNVILLIIVAYVSSNINTTLTKLDERNSLAQALLSDVTNNLTSAQMLLTQLTSLNVTLGDEISSLLIKVYNVSLQLGMVVNLTNAVIFEVNQVSSGAISSIQKQVSSVQGIITDVINLNSTISRHLLLQASEAINILLNYNQSINENLLNTGNTLISYLNTLNTTITSGLSGMLSNTPRPNLLKLLASTVVATNGPWSLITMNPNQYLLYGDAVDYNNTHVTIKKSGLYQVILSVRFVRELSSSSGGVYGLGVHYKNSDGVVCQNYLIGVSGASSSMNCMMYYILYAGDLLQFSKLVQTVGTSFTFTYIEVGVTLLTTQSF